MKERKEHRRMKKGVKKATDSGVDVKDTLRKYNMSIDDSSIDTQLLERTHTIAKRETTNSIKCHFIVFECLLSFILYFYFLNYGN